jgi:hypothetical protein
MCIFPYSSGDPPNIGSTKAAGNALKSYGRTVSDPTITSVMLWYAIAPAQGEMAKTVPAMWRTMVESHSCC